MPEAQADLFKEFFLKGEDKEECLKKIREDLRKGFPHYVEYVRRRALGAALNYFRKSVDEAIRQWNDDEVFLTQFPQQSIKQSQL